MTAGRLLFLLLASTLLLAQSNVAAQTTAPATSGPATSGPATSASLPELEPLIAKLSDTDWKVRTAAQDAIVALGDDAAPRLQQLQSESNDAEVRTAAESMLARIAAGRLTGPTLVTLHLKDAAPKHAVEELARRVNADLRVYPDSLWMHHKPGPVTLDADRRPFWDVLKELCEKTLLAPREMGQGETFALMQGGDDQLKGPSVTSGAFMIVANSVTESKSIRYGRNPVNQGTPSIVLMMTCFAEPKLRILSRSQSPTVEEAVDDAGHSLAPAPPRHAEHMTGNSGERIFTFHVNLKKVDGATATLARLKGSFRAVIEARSERLVIDDIMAAKGTAKEVAGRRFTVGEVVESGRQYRVKLTILRDRRALREPNQPWQETVNLNTVQLLDANGKPLRRGGASGGGSSEKLEYELMFNRDRDAAPPARLVWDLPVEAKEITVPFEFKDLPLP